MLSAYYYGNLSFPSVDSPKMGFLSTVPSDASQLLADAVAAATKAGKNYPGAYAPCVICGACMAYALWKCSCH